MIVLQVFASSSCPVQLLPALAKVAAEELDASLADVRCSYFRAESSLGEGRSSPLVVLRTDAGGTPVARSRVMQALALTLAKELGVELGDIVIRYDAVPTGCFFHGGRVQHVSSDGEKRREFYAQTLASETPVAPPTRKSSSGEKPRGPYSIRLVPDRPWASK